MLLFDGIRNTSGHKGGGGLGMVRIPDANDDRLFRNAFARATIRLTPGIVQVKHHLSPGHSVEILDQHAIWCRLVADIGPIPPNPGLVLVGEGLAGENQDG